VPLAVRSRGRRAPPGGGSDRWPCKVVRGGGEHGPRRPREASDAPAFQAVVEVR